MAQKAETFTTATPVAGDYFLGSKDPTGTPLTRNFPWQATRDGFALANINTQTGTSYTLALTDQGDIVEMNNAGANTLTIPTNAAVAFPVGTRIRVTQFGAGTTTVQGDTGVTVNGTSAGSEAISGQFAHLFLYQRAVDDWLAQSGGGGGGTPGGADTQVQYNNAGAFGGANVWVDDANTLSLRNGTTGQSFKVFRTDDGIGNNEYLGIRWNVSGTFVDISTVANGTGAVRGIRLIGPGAQIELTGPIRAQGNFQAIANYQLEGWRGWQNGVASDIDLPANTNRFGFWQSDGTATGDDGDFIFRNNNSLGNTNWHILPHAGAVTDWILTSEADVGFFGATRVAQQATTGTTTGFTAGVGTAVNDDSTFTGNSGTAAYTIGDIVLALKNYGLLAAS